MQNTHARHSDLLPETASNAATFREEIDVWNASLLFYHSAGNTTTMKSDEGLPPSGNYVWMYLAFCHDKNSYSGIGGGSYLRRAFARMHLYPGLLLDTTN